MDADLLHAPATMRFLTELASSAARALVRPHNSLAPPGSNGGSLRLPECQRYLALVEREFSCQVGAEEGGKDTGLRGEAEGGTAVWPQTAICEAIRSLHSGCLLVRDGRFVVAWLQV